ncbi:hypothetical protein Agub_g9353 [Astrephomene gubernaculifera]|uniref:FCP1 homology domain-containing protein n=1 Tax=Astrephomene gubernaculifera TaxID=47775 RepID=A0AAD3HNV6_9CHLO|nr:hypothetical protein Agub_g9353 [Astrephomene gubernaculifera]
MLAALRGVFQRWVGMTTEVQTMEPADTTLPGAPPTCSADYSASASTRKLKRTAGSSTTEAAEIKRPRTAPSTPIDSSGCGAGAPGLKLSAFDTDNDSRLAPAGPLHDNAASTRPTATASAPAALTRSMRSQPTASTATTSGGSGTHHGSGGTRHGAVGGSGATAVSGVAPPSPAESRDPHHHQYHHHHHPQAASAGENNSGGGAAASRGGSSAGGGGGSRHHTPHADAHQHALSLAHHRHDPLEEQVFSPGFHLPGSSAAASPAPSHGGAGAAAPSAAPTPGVSSGGEGKSLPEAEAAAHAQAGAAAAAAAAEGSAAGAEVARRQPLAAGVHVCGGGGGGQLHAIDLNVVEGVAVDSEDDEEALRAAAATAAAAIAAAGAEAASEAGAGAVGGEAVAVKPVGAGVALVAGGRPGPGRGQEGEAAAAEEEVEEGDEFEGGNDENAPAGWAVAAATVPAVAGAVPPPPQGAQLRTRVHVAQQQQQGVQQQQQQRPRDQVLVASAPRALAVAVATAMQQQQQQQLPTGAAAAEDEEPEEEAEEEDDEAAAEEEDEEEAFLEFDPLLFIKQLPPLESCVPPNRTPLLPPMTHHQPQPLLPSSSAAASHAAAARVAHAAGPGSSGTKRPLKTLVLDLDETLVHSSLEAVDRSDFSFPVLFNGMEHTVFVRQRPYLRDFMVRVSALFEVVVFTASQRIYAERLLDILDPGSELVRHRIYRDSCVVVDGNYLKDLSVLGRDLAHTVIVDNSPQAFGFQVDNGIPIESWYDDEADRELLKLLPFLEALAGEEVADVRPRIRAQFRLRELIDRA